MPSKLSISKLDVLGEIFEQKEWPIDHDNGVSRFNKYVKMLESMSDHEQDMMLELTKRFMHIKYEDYFTILLDVVKKIIEENPQINQYYVLPALSKQDEAEGRLDKSSINLLYLFKRGELEEALGTDKIHFQVVKDKERLLKKEIKNNEKILIVDDFIGSGETIEESLDLYNINKDDGPDINNIIVLSLVAHMQGLSYLSKIDVSIYYGIVIHKGISDNFTGDTKDTYITLMKQIEDRIPKITEDNRFGYKQCEALLHMYRIPNNTFPIYWLHRNISPYKR